MENVTEIERPSKAKGIYMSLAFSPGELFRSCRFPYIKLSFSPPGETPPQSLVPESPEGSTAASVAPDPNARPRIMPCFSDWVPWMMP